MDEKNISEALRQNEQKLIAENDGLKQDKQGRDKVIEDLQNERKEMEMELNELREEVKQLKLQNLDPRNYRQWKWEEIVTWIVNLDDGAYKKYEEKLRIALEEENIDGECFEHVDGSDIKSWGIVDFRHKKAVLRHIKSLVDKDVKRALIADNEGINIAPTANI